MANRCARPIADRAEQRQLAPPLEHVAQQHGREADGADQQAEPAERLKRRDVGVLDAVELGQPLGGGHGVRAEIARAVLDRRARSVAASAGGRVDQQELVALLVGKERAGNWRPT